MIPFFRKIRKKMADDNKPLKYLRYALGEILLIVIGILIALSINNWNTRAINKEYEQFYLQGIINDIELDLANLNYLITTDSLKVKSGKYLLNHFKNPTHKNDSLLLKQFSNTIPSTGYNQTDNVFEDLKSSGRLNYISNDALRKKIQEYYIDGEHIIKALNDNNSMSREIYTKHILSGEFDINSVLFAIYDFQTLDLKDIVEVSSFDSQFFYKPLNDPVIKEFIDRTSMNILLSQLNENRLKIGREKANNLISELKYYLKLI
jgi:hypothetical protein